VKSPGYVNYPDTSPSLAFPVMGITAGLPVIWAQSLSYATKEGITTCSRVISSGRRFRTQLDTPKLSKYKRC
jgi:hypothetical protein